MAPAQKGGPHYHEMHGNDSEIWRKEHGAHINDTLLFLPVSFFDEGQDKINKNESSTQQENIGLEKAFHLHQQENGVAKMKAAIMHQEKQAQASFGTNAAIHWSAVYFHTFRVGVFHRKNIQRIKKPQHYTL